MSLVLQHLSGPVYTEPDRLLRVKSSAGLSNYRQNIYATGQSNLCPLKECPDPDVIPTRRILPSSSRTKPIYDN